MTEYEYIATTNMARIEAEWYALQMVLPGRDGVVDEAELRDVRVTLYDWVEALRRSVENGRRSQAQRGDDAG